MQIKPFATLLALSSQTLQEALPQAQALSACQSDFLVLLQTKCRECPEALVRSLRPGRLEAREQVAKLFGAEAWPHFVLVLLQLPWLFFSTEAQYFW